METADVVLRISTATLLLSFLGLAIRDGWQHKSIRIASFAAASMAAVFLGPSATGTPFYVILRLVDVCSVPMVWWSALALFDEEFEIRPVHWAGLTAYALCIYPFRFWDLGWISTLPDWLAVTADLVTLSLIGHLIWKVVSGFQEDLVNRRRRFRIMFVSFIIVGLLTSLFGENTLQSAGLPQYTIMLIATVSFPVAVLLLFWVVRLQPETLLFQSVQMPEPKSPAIDPRDSVIHKRLVDLMEEDRVWAEPGLTIGLLAGRLGIPEHQLRNLINNGIGHRNFASFLNGYRLDYAKSVLADPEQGRLPVLTIAMDAGFGSLAPFNRAFKAAEGVTPTAFRSRALADQS
ncbi:MAG: AraC family transcriptional regulator [Pseudomonadota bacterium]